MFLEYCDSAKAVLISKEQYYLDLYRPNYNIFKTAGYTLGFKQTEETLAKLKLRKYSKGSLEKLRLHLSNLNLALNIKNVLKLIYTILVPVLLLLTNLWLKLQRLFTHILKLY